MRRRRDREPEQLVVASGFGTFDPDAFRPRGPVRALVGTMRGRLLLAGIACALLAGVFTYAALTSRSVSITQLVLVRPLAANSQVTSADVAAVAVPADAVPDAAVLINAMQVASGLTFTRVDLPAGTVLTTGPVGAFTRLTSQLLPGQVLASISVDARNAAGGAIKAGDVVDIYLSTPTPSITDQGSDQGDVAIEPDPAAAAASAAALVPSAPESAPAPSPLPSVSAAPDAAPVVAGLDEVEMTAGGLMVFRGVRILDASTDVDSITQVRPRVSGQGPAGAPGVDSPALKDGIPAIYKIGVTRPQADVLAAAVVAGQGVMFLTLAAPDIPAPDPSVAPPSSASPAPAMSPPPSPERASGAES